ncbi:MAG: YraN family protein [Lentilitoribacter sp.]|uniref:YraN family protein n=1 Tax=Tateyamaria sp. TaxID=1929288 RepID=UPI00326E8E7B
MAYLPVPSGFEASDAVVSARESRGRISYLAGLAAEDRVAAAYRARAYVLLEKRWRGKRGEIDLIFADGDGVVMVEVKASDSIETAMSHITRRQVRRLFATAEEYVGTRQKGSLTDIRFDVALMDQHGQVCVLENAFCGWV